MPASGAKAVGKWLWRNLLLVLLIVFMIGGTLTGILMVENGVELTQRQLKYFGFPGEILMRLLKMMIIPLVVSSLISGLANLDLKTSGKIGIRAVLYYVTTTVMAVILGIILCYTIRPGHRVDREEANIPPASAVPRVSSVDAIMDLVRNLFPDNLVEACFRLSRTVRLEDAASPDISNITNITNVTNIKSGSSSSNMSDPVEEEDYKIAIVKVDGMNIMGLVVFSVAAGMIVSARKSDCRAVIGFVQGLEIVTMRLVMVIMWYSPIGVFFLIAVKIVGMESAATFFAFLAYYSMTVIAGLVIHGLILLPLLFLIITRKNPLKYIWGMMPALVTALGTASSAATLPMTIRCLEENNGIDKRITRFVLPIGATINMDGTALYEAVAPMFIAQVRNIDLSFVQIIAVSITATFASIGAAAIPQAGLVTMVLVLTAVGLDPDDVTLIIAVDWFLDRLRTAINVLGDSIGAGIVAHFSKEELALIPADHHEFLDRPHEYGDIHPFDEREQPVAVVQQEAITTNDMEMGGQKTPPVDKGSAASTTL